MLARQQGGRHDHRHLLAAIAATEGGAQRDLGLAEADIAADEPVHRPAGRQIVERRVDGFVLILGLLIGKARAEFVVESVPAATGGAFQLPRGGDLDEPGRHVADALLHPALRFCQPAPPSRSSCALSSEP